MSKVASYLQSHLNGEVLDNAAARKYFSTDASVLEIKPSLIVYPRSTNDVRKVMRFTWQLAEKGHVLPVTARGSGTDQTGAALGKGIILVFPAHFNRILELDTQQKLVRLQPGVNFKSLQETLQTHGLFLPAFPASYRYSTVGGAIANNSAGEKSIKYGSMKQWVDKLEVVLANGELIQTGRLSRKQVERKKGLATMEGEIYRAVDGILNDNKDALDKYYQTLKVSRDNVGFNLRDLRQKDGSVDLTPLFVGSQGTLGVITEVILKVGTYSPNTSLVVAAFDSVATAVESLAGLRKLEPSILEMVDKNLLDFALREQSYALPDNLVGEGLNTAVILFIEFDNLSERLRRSKTRKAIRLLQTFTDRYVEAHDPDEQEKLWTIRYSSATVVNYNHAGQVAVPVLEDVAVPHDKLQDLIESIYALADKHHLSLAIWGHAGEASLHTQPILDLSKTGDRQKILRLMDDYYRKVVDMGGSIAAEHNEGRIRGPFVLLQTGKEIAEIFEKLKNSFDPHNVLNPGVKTGTDSTQVVAMLRDNYSLAHLSDHLPRT